MKHKNLRREPARECSMTDLFGEPRTLRLANVLCSECGTGFGPGDAHLSSCDQHQARAVPLQQLLEHAQPRECACFAGVCRCEVVDGRTPTGLHCKAHMAETLRADAS